MTLICSWYIRKFQSNPTDSCFREERSQTQILRQQQDEAYQASLRADQEKDRKKREEEEQIRQEEEKVRQTVLAEERRRRVSLLFLSICVIRSSPGDLMQWII